MFSLSRLSFVLFDVVFLPLGCSPYLSATQRRGSFSREHQASWGLPSLPPHQVCSSLSHPSPLGMERKPPAARITGSHEPSGAVPADPAGEAPASGLVRGGGGACRAAFPACTARGGGGALVLKGRVTQPPICGRRGGAVAGAWRVSVVALGLGG